jgi:hypothetical protein
MAGSTINAGVPIEVIERLTQNIGRECGSLLRKKKAEQSGLLSLLP